MHGQENSRQSLLRAVHVLILRDTDVPDHVSLRADRPQAAKVQYDEARSGQNRVDEKLQALSRQVVQKSAQNAG